MTVAAAAAVTAADPPAGKENPHAGQGSVVLDIGGEIGALVVTMPGWMNELEVEIVPTGTKQPRASAAHDHEHDHDHDHDHDGREHRHQHGHGGVAHSHPAGAPPHVAVVPRPTPDGSVVHSLVYGDLREGVYDLYVRPDGPVRLTATVFGGRVTETDWPADRP